MLPAPATLAARFPTRAISWRLRHTTLVFGREPLLMGIINVTPDSFSDGGRFFDPLRAVEHGLQLAAEGAAILDVGGESTRPMSEPVVLAEELRRVLPVVQRLAESTRVPISIDTSKADVAREALAAGAQVINDVTGFSRPELLALAADSGAGVCAMHMQGTPQTMQDNPQYQHVVEEISSYLRARRDALTRAGVSPDRICLDPGIGFGKSHQHNLELLAHAGDFHQLACPILIGHSRKGFVAKILNDKETDRTAASLGVALALARQGIQILRVHDVLATFQALKLFVAVGGIDGQPQQL